jgi:hypothetical protein
MVAARAYVAENHTERERLRALITRLSDGELSRPLPGGWTVAAVLAHAALWDAYALHRLATWERDAAPGAPETDDFAEAMNEASKPLCLALPPRTAAELALRLAEEADAKMAALDDATLARVRALAAPPFELARALHRREHLEEIERALTAL